MVALLDGCTNVPPQDLVQIKAAYRSYRSINKGATRTEVVALLGNGFRQENDGAYYWETRYDPLNYASIRVWFDPHDRARDVQVSRGWGIQDSASQANAIVDHER